jgi:hypothetical protein
MGHALMHVYPIDLSSQLSRHLALVKSQYSKHSDFDLDNLWSSSWRQMQAVASAGEQIKPAYEGLTQARYLSMELALMRRHR